ncbi:MAG: VOC family protein, partial [Pseudonocardia sp.]
ITVHTSFLPHTDPEASLAFYRDTLGFEKRLDAEFGAGRWLTVAAPEATTELALVATPEDDAVGVDTGIRLGTTDAEADHAHLRDQGVDVDAEILRFPQVPPMFTFRDVDGNTVVVVEMPA